MRIAYITADPGVPVFGQKGCSIHVQEVLRALAKRGAQIDLFATSIHRRKEADAQDSPAPLPSSVGSYEACDLLGLKNVRLFRLPPAPKGDLAFREQQCLAANAGLLSALQEQGPFSLVYERYSLWSFAGMEYARANATPGLLEVNAPLLEEQARHRGLVDQASAREVAERVFSAATGLLAVSEEVARYVESFETAQGKVHVVPNGVNPERFPAHLEASLPAGDGIFTVGFLGSMKPWHGLEKLIDAFARFHARWPDTRLLLVGDGPVREQLAAEAWSRNLGNAVQFTGAVAAGAVPGLLASMDVAVAPYPDLANFYFSPLKLYEYMAAGLPVIASRVGQIEQVIEDQLTGFLVPPGEVPALAEALERMREQPEFSRRLGQAARKKALLEHTWDRTVERILQIAGMDLAAHVAVNVQ